MGTYDGSAGPRSLSKVNCVGLLPSAFMVQSLMPPSSCLVLVKTSLPLYVPRVAVGFGDGWAAARTDFIAEALPCSVRRLVITTDARDANRSSNPNLM